MVTPLVEPAEAFPVAPSVYLEPPVPVKLDATPSATSQVSPLRVAADSPILDVFPSYLISPACSIYDLVTSPLTPVPAGGCLLQATNQSGHDGLVPFGGGWFAVGGYGGLTPALDAADASSGRCRFPRWGACCALWWDSGIVSGGPLWCASGRFGVGAAPQVLDSLPGCQYRMTSYDDDADQSYLDPAYGLHLHDMRLLEYVGAPESARLLDTSYGPGSGYLGCPSASAWCGTVPVQPAGLGQFVTSLNKMSSEVMQLAFAHEPFPTEAIQSVATISLSPTGQPTTCLPWGCGVRRVPRIFLNPYRRPHAMPAWCVGTVSRTYRSEHLPDLPRWTFAGLAEVGISRTCRSEHFPGLAEWTFAGLAEVNFSSRGGGGGAGWC